MGGTAGGSLGGSGDPGGGTGGTSPCANGAKDGAETDVDCGGATCGKCEVNRICAANSDCRTGNCSHLFCSLVSGPPNWLPGPSLHLPRADLVVAVEPLTNGNMLMLAIGGDDDGPAITSTSYEILDTTDMTPITWQQADVMLPFVYGGPAVTDAQGIILTFLDTSTWSYSRAAGWQRLSTVMPMPRTSTPRPTAAAALGPNGVVYIVGGTAQVSGAFDGVIQGYDPVANKWTDGLRPMPTPRMQLGLAAGSDGRLYAIGGLDSSFARSGVVEAYDIASDSWSTLSALPQDVAWPGVTSGPDGRIYALGGDSGLSPSFVNTVNAYTPKTNRWTPVAPLSEGRSGLGAVVSPDGHLYAVGGETGIGTSTVEIYGPVVNVSPQVAVPGDSVTVTGSNFAANATVSLYFGSVNGAAIATGTTDSSGKLIAPLNFKVPSLPAGNQPLVTIDDRSEYPITVQFRVQ